MTYDYDEQIEDDDIHEADSIHEENKTATKGAPFVKKKHGRTVDHTTVPANPVDADLLAGLAVEETEVVEVRRGKKVEDDKEVASKLPRLTDAETAKKQMKGKLAAAKKGFVMPEVDADPDEDEPRQAIVNGTMRRSDFDGFKATEADLKNPSYRHGSKIDNGPSGILRVIDDEDEAEHKLEESWHIRDAITHGYLGKDIEDKARQLSTLRRLRKDCDTALLDSVGVSVHTSGKDDSADHSLQKDQNSNVVYDLGMTLDRKKVSRVRKDGTAEAIYDGAVRKSKASKSGVTHGFDPSRDDLLPFAIIMAANNVEEIQASIGPLWPILMSVVCDNAKSATIGYMFEKTDPQASAVGNVIIKIALEEVAKIYERIDAREASSLPYAEWLDKQPNSLAVPARKLKAALQGNDNSPPSLAIAERPIRSVKSPRTEQRDIVTRAMNDIDLADLTLLATYATELKSARDGIAETHKPANDNERRYLDAVAA